MTRARSLILAGVFAVQLAVPGWAIVQREITLARGDAFRFRTTIVDPLDAFRGRYVRVGLADATFRVEDPERFVRRRPVFAAIGVDEDGFARLDGLSLEPPGSGPFLRVRAVSDGRGGLRIRPPFDRYYMNERLAPEAERVYREHSGEGGDAYLTVAIRNGNPVVEGLYVEDEPIEDYVRRLQAEKKTAP